MIKLTQQEAANILTLLTQAKHDRHAWDNVTAIIGDLKQKIETSVAEEEPPPPDELLKKPSPRRRRK